MLRNGWVSFVPRILRNFGAARIQRGVALLHSFAYAAAEEAFQKVAEQDPQCGMAHWGIAMTHFHQLWEPPLSPGSTAMAEREMAQADAHRSNYGSRARVHPRGRFSIPRSQFRAISGKGTEL